jgi:hypothetical protein
VLNNTPPTTDNSQLTRRNYHAIPPTNTYRVSVLPAADHHPRIRLSTSANSRSRNALLAGRLNSFTCPYCRNAGALATPFFYHDADKELALLFIPMNINVKEADQQKMIGRLTQQVMSNLSPEKRKAYLLQPQQFFNLKTMIETILMPTASRRRCWRRKKRG